MRRYVLVTMFSLCLSFLLFSSVLAESHNAYFDWLSSQPETILSKPYRTQAEIDADPYGGPGNVVYNASEDAAQFTLPAGTGGDSSIPLKDQLRTSFAITPMTVGSGNLLVFYELKHESGFASNGAVDGLKTHKAVQIAKDTGRQQTIEPRYRYSNVNLPYVARVDVRVYGRGIGYKPGSFNTIAPQAGEFKVLPDVWVRHWLFIDIDNKKLSYWVGDETRANVTILDNVDLDYDAAWHGKNFRTFWFEFNSSSKRDVGAPALNFWARNLVILKNISDISFIVAPGNQDQDQDITPPSPPSNLFVE